MLASTLGMLYATHLLIEGVNLGVICYVVSSTAHSLSSSSRGLYTLSLYVEMVWLLVPSGAIALLIARVLVMQCGDEEL